MIFPACRLPCPPPSLKAEGSLVVSCQLRDSQDPIPHPPTKHTKSQAEAAQSHTADRVSAGSLVPGMDFGLYFLGHALLAFGK